MILKKTKRVLMGITASMCTIFATTCISNAASADVPATLMIPASTFDEVLDIKPPQTGDSFSALPWVIVCAAALILCIIVFATKKKKEK